MLKRLLDRYRREAITGQFAKWSTRRGQNDPLQEIAPASIAATRKRSLKRPTTSSVVTPTDPVEPRIEIAFITPRLSRSGLYEPPAETPERHQRKVMRIQMIAKIKVIRKTVAGGFHLSPR